MATQSSMTPTTNVLELICSNCLKRFDANFEQHVCLCGRPLMARYDLKKAAETLTLKNLESRPRTLWRYAEVLPNGEIVSLGEGMTAADSRREARRVDGTEESVCEGRRAQSDGFVQGARYDRGCKPSEAARSEDARGADCGKRRRRLAAYAAAAGLAAVIVMPSDTPIANVMECQAFGAKVIKIDGLISDCGKYRCREQRERRLVRRLNTQGAISR